MQETWVPSLSWEDTLEKETATHSSIIAWRIPWTEQPGRLQSTGSQRVGHAWAHIGNVCVHTYIDTCVCICVYKYIHRHVYVCMCVYTHMCTRVCVCVCVCVCTRRPTYKWQCFWNKYSNFLSWWIRLPKAFRHTQSFKMSSINIKAQTHVLTRWHLKTQFRLSAILALHLNYANINGLFYSWRSTPDTFPQFSLLPIPT